MCTAHTCLYVDLIFFFQFRMLAQNAAKSSCQRWINHWKRFLNLIWILISVYDSKYSIRKQSKWFFCFWKMFGCTSVMPPQFDQFNFQINYDLGSLKDIGKEPALFLVMICFAQMWFHQSEIKPFVMDILSNCIICFDTLYQKRIR